MYVRRRLKNITKGNLTTTASVGDGMYVVVKYIANLWQCQHVEYLYEKRLLELQ